jgi:tripeptide aminopeptidase
MRAYERLLNYVVVPTKSCDEMAGVKTPSTDEQWVLARKLVEELLSLGIKDAAVDDRSIHHTRDPAQHPYRRS